jgi:hypothetical protein
MNYPEASLWVSKVVSRQDPLYEASFGEWTRGAFKIETVRLITEGGRKVSDIVMIMR